MAFRLGGLIGAGADFCLNATLPEFFRRIQIEGHPLHDRDQYLMVVANHPYGIQDAFLLSYAYERPFYFAATAMNFQRREGDVIKPRRLRGWLLRQCRVLPIVRNRSEGHMSTNLETFAAAADMISQGYAFGIFAEGDSRGNQWKLLKLKAGAAQIALQVADLLKHQQRRLKIQVVGLTYTNWTRPFKSSVTLQFAEPFAIDRVDLSDRSETRKARREITDRLTALMQAHTVTVPEEHSELVGKIAQFYTVSQPSDYVRLRTVSRYVQAFVARHGDRRGDIEAKLDEYLALAEELKLYPGEERHQPNKLLLALVSLPALLGGLLHWPILAATRRMVPLETTALHSLGDKRVTWGIGFTLMWYAVISALVVWVGAVSDGWWAVPRACGVVAVMGFCGLIASKYLRSVVLLLRGLPPTSRRFRRYRQLGAELLNQLEGYRAILSGEKPSAA